MSSLVTAPVLRLAHWSRHADATEQALLREVIGPVLDIGCGPGRLVAALERRGIPAVGIDAAPAAIAMAKSRGTRAYTKSVFDPIPHEGAWLTVLLVDGNIGIGGDPARLLSRVHALLAPGGRAIVELEPPGTATHGGLVRLEVATGMVGWFPWYWVGADDIAELAARASLVSERCCNRGGRWFTWLRRPVA
jgi:SAM-dependent methyltransferase